VQQKVLIVEDETKIREIVKIYLERDGFSVYEASTGLEGLEVFQEVEPDLVILDLMLPELSGEEVCSAIRSKWETPIIMLTARTSLADTVEGLETGANDYVPKPFKFDELLARIRVRLRESSPNQAPDLVAGDLSLDVRTRRAIIGDETVELSAREFALAEEFVRNHDQVLSREQLLSRVWGFDYDPGSNVVDVYVRYLRNKLGTDRIETVRGMGYRLK